MFYVEFPEMLMLKTKLISNGVSSVCEVSDENLVFIKDFSMPLTLVDTDNNTKVIRTAGEIIDKLYDVVIINCLIVDYVKLAIVRLGSVSPNWDSFFRNKQYLLRNISHTTNKTQCDRGYFVSDGCLYYNGGGVKDVSLYNFAIYYLSDDGDSIVLYPVDISINSNMFFINKGKVKGIRDLSNVNKDNDIALVKKFLKCYM